MNPAVLPGAPAIILSGPSYMTRTGSNAMTATDESLSQREDKIRP
jgi:hypothetical protein